MTLLILARGPIFQNSENEVEIKDGTVKTYFTKRSDQEFDLQHSPLPPPRKFIGRLGTSPSTMILSNQAGNRMLPEEILHAIAESLAYNRVFIERQLIQFRWKYARSELLSLSATDRQWRRICLPFLFSSIEVNVTTIKDLGRIERLREEFVTKETIANCVRAFTLSYAPKNDPPCFSSEQYSNEKRSLIGLLSCLSNLSQLSLSALDVDAPLVAALNRHSVSTVIIDSPMTATLPPALDLVKFIRKAINLRPTSSFEVVDDELSRGMQTKQLTLAHPHVLGDLLAVRRFHGLRELVLTFTGSTLYFSWLPNFLHAHPLLMKITFNGKNRCFSNNIDSIPFIRPFLEEMRQLTPNSTHLRSFAVTRDSSCTKVASSLDNNWHVTGLRFSTGSPGPVLPIVYSHFSKLSILSLVFDVVIQIDDFISSLQSFTSLRVVSLFHAFSNLNSATIVEGEASLIHSIAQIAHQIPSIEAFYVLQRGGSRPVSWALKGWIETCLLRGEFDYEKLAGTLDYIDCSPSRKNSVLRKHNGITYLV